MAFAYDLPLEDLVALLDPDPVALADGARRMADVWHGRPTDFLPIAFHTPCPDLDVSSRDMLRHVSEPECMLRDGLLDLIALAHSGSDAALALRADTGTGTLATVVGCRQIPSAYALPWTEHASAEAIAAFDPDAADIASQGAMPRVRELYSFLRAHLPPSVGLFYADTQGPFDLAHIIRGAGILTDVSDDPDAVRLLL